MNKSAIIITTLIIILFSLGGIEFLASIKARKLLYNNYSNVLAHQSKSKINLYIKNYIITETTIYYIHPPENNIVTKESIINVDIYVLKRQPLISWYIDEIIELELYDVTLSDVSKIVNNIDLYANDYPKYIEFNKQKIKVRIFEKTKVLKERKQRTEKFQKILEDAVQRDKKEFRNAYETLHKQVPNFTKLSEKEKEIEVYRFIAGIETYKTNNEF